MRILTIHADYIEVEARQKAIKDADELKSNEKERVEELLVVFTAIEQGDENIEETSAKLAKESIAVANQVKTKKIMLYPFVHLTSKPSAPKIAQKILQVSEELIKNSGFVTSRAPFGWYKAFAIKGKGHPLAELSREIKGSEKVIETLAIKEVQPKEEVSKSLQQESEVKSRFYILDEQGVLNDVEKFNYSKHPLLKKLVTYETKKVRTYEKEPPHIKLMKDHSLIDYEPGSDSGNFRLLPKGRLMKKILERMITDWCIDYGALEVESPIMYDFEHPSLKKYLNRFPARQYVVLSDEKKFFLRFAACFGQFLIAHDMVISHKHLPLKLFELTRYSFRREQSGELAGLKRLRAFTMPDMHTLVLDTNMAKEEFERQYDLSLKWNELIGVKTDIAFRVQEDFFNENKEWYISLIKKAGKPILIELFKERYAYFITKFEFNFIDSMDKASTLSTVQIDVENADTYDINFTDSDGGKKRPLILHASISGSLERVIYAMLEDQAMKMASGKKGIFPLWLSPTQLRILPLGEGQREYAHKIYSKISSENSIRIDIDDRDEPLGKKIRDAQKEWIPYIAVIGEKEQQSGLLSVNIREPDSKKEMTIEELLKLIKDQTKEIPFEKLSLSGEISKRPGI